MSNNSNLRYFIQLNKHPNNLWTFDSAILALWIIKDNNCVKIIRSVDKWISTYRMTHNLIFVGFLFEYMCNIDLEFSYWYVLACL